MTQKVHKMTIHKKGQVLLWVMLISVQTVYYTKCLAYSLISV